MSIYLIITRSSLHLTKFLDTNYRTKKQYEMLYGMVAGHYMQLVNCNQIPNKS